MSGPLGGLKNATSSRMLTKRLLEPGRARLLWDDARAAVRTTRVAREPLADAPVVEAVAALQLRDLFVVLKLGQADRALVMRLVRARTRAVECQGAGAGARPPSQGAAPLSGAGVCAHSRPGARACSRPCGGARP